MKLARLIHLLLILSPAPLASQAGEAEAGFITDPALQMALDSVAEGFAGRVGVYARHLGSNEGAALAADEVFPTASLIKIPLLLTLAQRLEDGAFGWEESVAYPDTLRYQYTERTDVLGYLEPGDTLPLSEVAFLMLSVSDNHASLWIQALVGGGAAVNEWLELRGFRHTRVNSRTPQREAARAAFGWGQTSPREMAEMLVMIREGRAVSREASERMYRLLTNSYWDDGALSTLPPDVQVASKQGFVDRSRSEVLLVNAPGGDYVLAVITADQEDTSHHPDNEGSRLIRAISRLVYRHFNPGDQRVPPARN